ncbi:MAG: pentapeptide repeat-containing protein [Planctomycetes bacterium]|nr:pentapeptide repeat-containing protein [Planctomycetota bacterium]
MRGARLSNPCLRGARLSNPCLRGARVSNTCLRGARVSNPRPTFADPASEAPIFEPSALAACPHRSRDWGFRRQGRRTLYAGICRTLKR